ncbi:NucA/NucB deoxyribonuclease domain-containing protein [Frankia sp. AgKG'84/4]|uniref:NucA/NucB deoxyribonuclease domain-containing protein n=1 Tax=Frankia sp. AgKG'84/4 TaxID=573490 RepID=UPI00202A9DD2|nr:NucA/NucB deoxyribonuclease domain-containing protein [Frankia sp. AgKG'84/4]MCL9796226.1 NucA/NucB deoxyribonuclease domain-containing protein [Frankia sp. AgKG'84/4]
MRRRRRSTFAILAVVGASLLAGLGATPASAAPAPAPLIQACLAKGASNNAYTDAGWYRTRNQWCRNSIIRAGETGGGQAGAVQAAVAIGVTTSPTDLSVHVDMYIRPISATGTLANALLDVELPCTGCTATGVTNGRAALLSGWRDNGNTTFDFTAGLGTGVDKVANHAFHPRFLLDGGRLAKESTGTAFRCDSASYINAGNTPGCVFPQTHPTLTYDAKLQPNAKDTIAHIRLALTKPTSTQPLWLGSDAGKKTIPSVLHRQTSKSKNRANNRAAAAVCRSIDPSYVSKGNDCDEFPFESSQEGAAKGDKRFSALPVRLGDNRSAGSTLGKFYTDLRVLEGEEYHVAVPR